MYGELPEKKTVINGHVENPLYFNTQITNVHVKLLPDKLHSISQEEC